MATKDTIYKNMHQGVETFTKCGETFHACFFLYAVGLTIINRGATSYHTYYSKEGRRKKKKMTEGLLFFCCRSKKIVEISLPHPKQVYILTI